jgi:uncharacterized membrane protein
LPPAEAFQLYEQACPGAGDKILTYLEKEQHHRHMVDIDELKLLQKAQLYGFSSIIGCITASLVALFMGSELIAGLFIAGSFIGGLNKLLRG